MQSPTALHEYVADHVGGHSGAPVLPANALEPPTGTGPFVFGSRSPGEGVVLPANPDYWGEQGEVTRVVFPIIDDPTARRQALEAGDIDGYDLVGPADVVALDEAGYEIVNRDPFNILYLGMNQAVPELADVRVRQAIAHAIDREALVAATLPEGTEVATNFVPPSVVGWNDDVQTYEFDQDAARDLLAEAGFADGLTINFTYPTNVSRPYMPTPVQVFERIAASPTTSRWCGRSPTTPASWRRAGSSSRARRTSSSTPPRSPTPSASSPPSPAGRWSSACSGPHPPRPPAHFHRTVEHGLVSPHFATRANLTARVALPSSHGTAPRRTLARSLGAPPITLQSAVKIAGVAKCGESRRCCKVR